MATILYLKEATEKHPLWDNSNFIFSFRDSSRSITAGADTFDGAQAVKLLSTTIATGTGVENPVNTVAGPTAGKLMASSPWISNPLAADITISGTVSFNMWAYETGMNANCTIRIMLLRLNEQGAGSVIMDSSFGTELGTSKALKTWSGTPTSTAMKRGDRIVLLVLTDDATSLTMGTGFSMILASDGSNANSADSRVTFNENLTFITAAPTGTTYYLRNEASPVSVGVNELQLSTSPGSSSVNAVHTTLAGPTAYPGDQWTDTAGGSDVEWYTPELVAFTLGGVVQVVVSMADGTTIDGHFNATPWDLNMFELAVCNSDGSSPVVWARSYTNDYYTTGGGNPAVHKYYITGPDVAVTVGQRIRLRVYSDDCWPSFTASGIDRTFTYAGSSSETRLVFTQTLTEYGRSLPIGRRDRKIIPLI